MRVKKKRVEIKYEVEFIITTALVNKLPRLLLKLARRVGFWSGLSLIPFSVTESR